MGLRQLLHSEPYRGLKDSSSSLIVESTDHRDSGYGQEQFEQRKPGNTFLRHDTDNDADENEECTEFVAAEDGHDPSRLIVHTVDAMIAQYTSLSSLTRSKGVEEESHAEPEDAITSAAANAEGSLRNSGSSLAEPTPSADLVRRTLIVYEIYTSEHSYVNSLMSLKRQYYDELLRYVDTPDEVVSRRQVNAMFGNLLEIVLVNSELLARIESRLFAPQAIRNGLGLTTLGTVKSRDTLAWKPDMPFADVLGEMAPFLKCYSAYARNFNSALQETSRMLSNNARFAAFLKSAERNSALGLQALLILPIQRIPRYRLLLADLLKHTASSHADMTNLTSTFKIVEDVATYVNEDIRQYEMQIELLGVQKSLVGYGEQLVMPGRRLLKMGGVRKVSRRTVDDRVLILLSDALLIASPVTMPSVGSRIGQAPQPLLFHRLIALASCRVEGVADNPVHQHIFQLCTQEKSFVVMTDCERTKLDWISAIRQAIDQAQSSPVRVKGNDDNSGATASSSSPLPIVSSYSAPVWEPNSASAVCRMCDAAFGLLNRRHHCRLCGDLICGVCSTYSFLVAGAEHRGPQRCCNSCYRQHFLSQSFYASGYAKSSQTRTFSLLPEHTIPPRTLTTALEVGSNCLDFHAL